jgi:hypothetical protein
MKKFLQVVLVLLSLFSVFAQAQMASGWSEGDYYERRGQISDVCGLPFLVSVDFYGRPVACARTCQRAVWQSYKGTRNGYMWQCGQFGCSWQTNYQYATWCSYNWSSVTVPASCF